MVDGALNSNVPISSELVEQILLGPTEDRRQLQDSPILIDVWLAYAKEPSGIQDLLITPFRKEPAGRVAGSISKQVASEGKRRKAGEESNIAYLQGIVAARLFFEEVLQVVVPMTQWWHDNEVSRKLDEYDADRATSTIRAIFKSLDSREPQAQQSEGQEPFSALDRYIALAGLILWAGKHKPGTRRDSKPADTKQPPIGALRREGTMQIVQLLLNVFRKIKQAPPAGKLIWQVALNRIATSALDKSIPAVKADAARTLFGVRCDQIAWAILDSGIDASHEAFKGADGNSRVKETLDFTRIREIVSVDNLHQKTAKDLIAQVFDRGDVDLNKEQASEHLRTLAKDAEEERPMRWELVEKFIRIKQPGTPASAHGTHVAGIIGASAGVLVTASKLANGMCPDITLYDFRVLSKSLEDTEFAIIAALQYIRHLNERHNHISIHGANLSLSIPHNVRNYACGRTPVCNECERLVESGVVVVAAAGNRGYQNFETKEGLYEGYAAFSITDPGNAEGVITVGATHRYWPHTYGVSFFSSRGPTGDGRAKPDLVAPGERIHGPLPNGDWGQQDGTSMAAPHVSGAAAMLMARYTELIGHPRRIKSILCESATDLGREKGFQGHGMLDVLRALQSI